LVLQLYYYLMAGSVLCIFGVILLGGALRSYLAAAIVSFIGVVSAIGGACIAYWGNLTEAQGSHWNFLGFALFDSLIFALCITRWKWSKRALEEKLSVVRNQSKNPRDAVLLIDGCRVPGTCWECGKAQAPLRAFRLSRVVVLPILVGGESVFPQVPLCESHSNHMHVLPRWVLMLNGPLAFLLFLSPLIILGDAFERYSRESRQAVMLAALIISLGLYVYSIIWAYKKQRFRLHALDAPNGIMTIRFSDASVAEKVRNETEKAMAY
jgi:hypothetical protein